MDRENEQYPAESAGNREERNPGELEENNRSSDILPSEEEQLQILEEKAEEKSPAFSFSQELIDEVLQDGPHFADGKYDIYSYLKQEHSTSENVKFLQGAYGMGGRTLNINGIKLDENYDSKGIKLRKGYEVDSPEILLKWNVVVKRVGELIAVGRYLSEQEQKEFPEYEKRKIARGRPLQEESELQLISDRAVTESENESADYDISEDTVVTIGMKDYEVEFLSAERVVLRDQQYPIFSEELSREEFDRKICENPANDHLKIKRPLPELPAEEEKEAQPTDVPSEETETELSIPEQNYQFVMKMAGEVLRGEVDFKTFEAGAGFMPLTIEQVGDNFIVISHYYEQNGDAMADPDMEFAYDNDRKTLQARTYQQDALQRYDEVYGDDGYNEELEEELNLFAHEWFQTIEKQGYVPVQEAAELEAGELPAEEENTLELAPSWEQGEPAKKAQSYDLYPEVSGQNRHQYQIMEEVPEYGSAKEKFRANIAAIQLLKKCENEHRYATPEEQEILAKYVGWGGLSDAFDPKKSAWAAEYLELQTVLSEEEYESARESTLTAFYTPPIVIKSMYQALENMGLKSGNILEPSCGVGNFIGMKPESLSDCKMYGVELDSVSGRIAAQLYQKSKIAVEGYEKVNLPDSFFDVAIGNVPFGEFKVFDSRYDRYNFFIHDYFFAKTLDKVRPGGVIAFITSSGTMDKKNPYVRRYLAQRAELIGAIRLPNDTFTKNAGTKVTSDILFLQKRDHMTLEEPDWVYLDYDDNGIEQNRYYVQHPEMILGEMVMESGPYGMRSTCRPYEGRELSELLSVAVEALKGTIEEVEMEELVEEEDHTIPADPSVSNYSYTLVDGKIYYRENSRMKPVTLPVTGVNRVKGMIAIRDCARELIRYQTEGYSDAVIEGQQKELNRLYDLFRSKYGLLNDRANMRVFADDNSYPLLSSLEILAEDGTLERKADMFSKRTIKAHKVVNSVDTASEALSISLAEKAKVDMPFMAKLTGKTEEELEQELSGVVFRLPESDTENPKYVSEDEYLSGNVREKLKVAELAAQADVRYQVNVTALQKVQPKDLSASEINIRLGTTWLPESDVEDFMFQLLNTPNYMQWKIKVHFSKYTGEWQVEGRSLDKGNVKANNTYGTTRVSAYRIIEDTLNLRDVRIYDYVEDDDRKKKAVLNKKETAIAQGKQDLIKQAFQDWIWKEPERRQRLTDYYNENFNAIRPREYDGSHLNFYGMNPEIRLREHQKNGVARILYGGNTLLAYVVGAGKTYTMVAAAMESKRLGLCHKSMVVVPNHIIEQFAAEWLQLYPAANLLVATKKDFETKNRKRFCARIATSDIDAVIIGHSQFERIPLSIERQQRTIRSQIEELVQGITEEKARNGNKFTIKQLEKTKKSLLVRLEKLNDQSKKDQVINFEELGIDRLFVDEADGYKNLYLYTKMRNVAGIAQTEALKSSDMFMKCQYLDELTGGKGVVFATGTPVSNSVVELYTMQRYLQHHTLVEHNLQHFDAWASTFGETVTAIELAPEGTGYRLKTRFAKFYNLPELMQMFREVADIQTADMLNLPVPEVEYRVVSVKPSEMQRDMVAELGERAERVRDGMVNATEDNMLLITNDGRKLALDQRMMNELLPDYPESKVNACVEEVYNFWEQGQEKRLTQLVFCDLSTPKTDGSFSVYNDVRDKLIAKGIPPEEIAFIHDANTEVRKKELFSKVRRGAVRILMGSTFKMGAGTNVQDLIIASHDLDCPWRPRDLEQRAGRTVRQGNKNPKVDIVRYVTEGTFDAYLYQIIENKQKFISQIMTSKSPARSVEDIDEVALSYAEIKALAVGNPYIKEKMDLDIQVSKLQLLKQSFLSQKYEMEDKAVRYFPNEIKQCEQRIADYESDIALAKENTPPDRETFPAMQIHDVVYTEKKEAGQAIIEACKAMKSAEAVLLGRYRGFPMKLSYDSFQKVFIISMYGKQVYHVPLGSDIHGNITRLDNKIQELPDKMLRWQDELENLKVQLENAKEEAQKEFPQEEELAEKVARLGELNVLLDMDKKDQVLLDDGEGVEIEPEQKKKERER
ncbi:helicase [Faecalicatena contorta]|nr:helicase [Faecalicatena contorta]MCF2668395.1 helicase [Faecalicatena contorta]MCF2680019.1 helicase [Faecalicatena contorta]